jgi:hypothetical protein
MVTHRALLATSFLLPRLFSHLAIHATAALPLAPLRVTTRNKAHVYLKYLEDRSP